MEKVTHAKFREDVCVWDIQKDGSCTKIVLGITKETADVRNKRMWNHQGDILEVIIEVCKALHVKQST